MNVREAYNQWANQYDTNHNRTRDLEATALRECLSALPVTNCLEIGCGTGKNTQWLVTKAASVTAVDFSDEMLQHAKQKVTAPNVQFIQADITQPWQFTGGPYSLVTFSLVLEHIEKLSHIFSQCAQYLQRGGYVYIGELHPFKQYTGSKARFETEGGTQVVTCFTHNISDFVQEAKKYDLLLRDFKEYFDDGDTTTLPRIVTLLLKKEG
ncbi:MAG TPA: class I SAM-dependent methyltransferase [Chitinophagaceae bacterium]|nr:class I SAM-dependent methyltransferase [Chitinophagaceae bacterium]